MTPTSKPIRNGAIAATRNAIESDGGKTIFSYSPRELMNLFTGRDRNRNREAFVSGPIEVRTLRFESTPCSVKFNQQVETTVAVSLPDEPIIDVTKVSEKGQVVIPKEIRDKLGFVEGSRLIVVATDDAVILQRVETIAGKIRMRDLLDRVRSLTDRLAFGRG